MSEKHFTKLDFARWYCSFNRFEWPDDFPAAKPDFWVDERNPYKQPKEQQKITSAMCIALEIMAGAKLCSRVWNENRMTDNEFEKFWAEWQAQQQQQRQPAVN